MLVAYGIPGALGTITADRRAAIDGIGDIAVWTPTAAHVAWWHGLTGDVRRRWNLGTALTSPSRRITGYGATGTDDVRVDVQAGLRTDVDVQYRDG
jgi:hypothetical protein